MTRTVGRPPFAAGGLRGFPRRRTCPALLDAHAEVVGPPAGRPRARSPCRWVRRRSPTGSRPAGWRWSTGSRRLGPTSSCRRRGGATSCTSGARPSASPSRRPPSASSVASTGCPAGRPPCGRCGPVSTRSCPRPSRSGDDTPLADQLRVNGFARVPAVFAPRRGRRPAGRGHPPHRRWPEPDDQRSWWARTGAGDEVCCRLLYTDERSDAIPEVVTGDDRLADLLAPDRARPSASPSTASTA